MISAVYCFMIGHVLRFLFQYFKHLVADYINSFNPIQKQFFFPLFVNPHHLEHRRLLLSECYQK
jgi:hypothetical protein